jgi:hypothetical protein
MVEFVIRRGLAISERLLTYVLRSGQALRSAIVVAALAGSFLTLPAAAAKPVAEGCAAADAQWLGGLEAATGTRGELVRCWPMSVRIRLQCGDAAALDVELATGEGEAFRRVGALRLRPVVDVEDFSDLPAEQQAAFAALETWLTAGAAERAPIAATGRAAAPGTVPWTLLYALVGTGLLAWSERRRLRDRWAAIALLSGATFAVRAALGPFAPHHVNGQGPLWIELASGRFDVLPRYGPGYAELLHPLVAAVPGPPDAVVFWTGVAASAALPALVAGLAGRVGGGVWLAAAAVFADPVLTRIGATESYLVPILALVLASGLGAATAAEALGAGDRRRAAVALLAAGLLASAAARIHPVAWIPVALAPLVAAAVPGSGVGLAAARRAAIALGAVGAVVLATSGRAILALLPAVAASEGATSLTRALEDPGRAHVYAFFGALLVAAALRWGRARPLVSVAAVHGLVLAWTQGVHDQGALGQASFDRLYLALPLIAATAQIPAWWLRRPWLAPTVAAALLAVGWTTATGRTTEQREYAWLAAELAHLPPRCHVAWVPRAGRRVLALPTWRVPESPRDGSTQLDARDPGAVASRLAAGHCVAYVESSLCASAEGRPVCESARARLPLRKLATVDLPAIPTMDRLPYDVAPVPVSVFEVMPASSRE